MNYTLVILIISIAIMYELIRFFFPLLAVQLLAIYVQHLTWLRKGLIIFRSYAYFDGNFESMRLFAFAF